MAYKPNTSKTDQEIDFTFITEKNKREKRIQNNKRFGGRESHKSIHRQQCDMEDSFDNKRLLQIVQSIRDIPDMHNLEIEGDYAELVY